MSSRHTPGQVNSLGGKLQGTNYTLELTGSITVVNPGMPNETMEGTITSGRMIKDGVDLAVGDGLLSLPVELLNTLIDSVSSAAAPPLEVVAEAGSGIIEIINSSVEPMMSMQLKAIIVDENDRELVVEPFFQPVMNNMMQPEIGKFQINQTDLQAAIDHAIFHAPGWNPSTVITEIEIFEDTNYSNTIEASEDSVVLSYSGFTNAAASATAVPGADVTLTRFDNIQSAIDSATDVDGNGSIVIALSSGEYNQSFTINRDVEIWGARKGEAISKDSADGDTKVDEVSEVFFDIYDGSRESGDPETWINGTVTVASDDVTLDGLRLHAFSGPLDFAGTDIDNFSLLNSYVTGFKGQNSFRYLDTDGTASTGWTIDGNLIGGVSAGVGGSLYLTGVDASTISDNVFWRPGASHMYLEDVSGLTIQDNFFVQGLHADGANSDGTYNSLTAFSNWGYFGFSGFQW